MEKRFIESKKELVNKLYPEILAIVKEGIPVYKALKKFGINSSYFYPNLTEEQKAELKMAKVANSWGGVLCHGIKKKNFNLD